VNAINVVNVAKP